MGHAWSPVTVGDRVVCNVCGGTERMCIGRRPTWFGLEVPSRNTPFVAFVTPRLSEIERPWVPVELPEDVAERRERVKRWQEEAATQGRSQRAPFDADGTYRPSVPAYFGVDMGRGDSWSAVRGPDGRWSAPIYPSLQWRDAEQQRFYEGWAAYDDALPLMTAERRHAGYKAELIELNRWWAL